MRKINFLLLFILWLPCSLVLAQFDEDRGKGKADDDDPCSLNAGEPTSYCSDVDMFMLMGSVTNDPNFSGFEWSQSGGPLVTIVSPNDLITPVIPAPSAEFAPGPYEFTLTGRCTIEGTEILIEQTVQITILDFPNINITHNGGVQTAADKYVGCRKIEFIANNGLLPNQTGVWNVEPDNVDDLTVIIDPADPHIINLALTNYSSLCGDIFELTYTLTDEDGCTSTSQFEVTFTGGPEDDYTYVSPNPHVLCDDSRNLYPWFPGCEEYVDITSLTITGPAGNTATAVANYQNNNRLRIRLENLERIAGDGTYTVNIQATNEYCGDSDLTYIYDVFEDYELGNPLADEVWFCDGQVPDQTLSIVGFEPNGTTQICWDINTTPNSAIEGVFCNNMPTYELTDVPADTYVGVWVTVTNGNCTDQDFGHLGVKNDLEVAIPQENVDCGDGAYFVVFNDYLKDMLYSYNASSYYTFLVEAISPSQMDYDFQWGDIDGDGFPDLILDEYTGFAATEVGEYVFEISSTNPDNPACNETQTFTIIVGPGGSLANAGTDFPPSCVTTAQLVGNVPLEPGVSVLWSEVTNAGATILDPTSPTTSVDLVQGEYYVFEYRIFIDGNDDCVSTDQVILDNTNCDDCSISFGGMSCVEDVTVGTDPCDFFTIVVNGEEFDSDVVISITNLPTNGFNCAEATVNGVPLGCSVDPDQLQWTSNTSYDWIIPTVVPGETYTLVLAYCWAQITSPVATNDDCNISTTCTTTIPTCFDGIQNQGEEGIDCGGPCPACECPISFDSFSSEDIFVDGDTPCHRYTLVVDGLVDASNVVIQLAGMPGNGFNCSEATVNGVPLGCSVDPSQLQWTSNTSWNWVIPNVVAGQMYTLELVYCWSTETTPIATHSSSGCDISINSMMMLIDSNDKNSLETSGEKDRIAFQNEVGGESEIKFFPNPAKDQLFFVNGKSSDQLIEFFSLEGKKIHGFNLSANTRKSISLNTLDSGIYLVKVTDRITKEIRTKKLVIIN